MDSPAVSESVNGSNNICRAEELDNYEKGVQVWQPSLIKHAWRSFWPRKDAGCSPSTADPLPKSGTQKIKDAIQSIKFKDDRCVLVQFWAPDQPAGRGCLLTTSNQPFVFTEINDELGSFRIASLKEEFYVNLEKEVGIGLIGRVFLKGSPEWTPNVQYYSREEYPQLHEAVQCNVRGSLALPVFDGNGRCCLGVLEIVTAVEKESYDCEFKEICRALEGVNLKSSEVFPRPTKKVGRNSKAKVKSGVDVVQTKKIRKTKTSGITKEDLTRHFDKPRAVAAAEFNIKKSSLRNLCKRLGIPKWPYKKRSRGSCILGKHDKETLGQTELDTRSTEDLSTLTSEDDYGAEVMDDQYLVEVFEAASLGVDVDHMVNATATNEVIKTSSLVEPYATLAAAREDDLIHVSNEEEYRADQNMDELSYSEFWAQTFDFLG